MKNRWGITRTPEGGISAGWTSLNTMLRCPRQGYWGLLHQGRGIQMPPLPPNEAMLYGKLWHGGYRTSWKGIPLLEGLHKVLAEDELEALDFQDICEEVVRDLDWYFNETRGDQTEWEVLACEDELRVQVGRHILRGTPDIVARSSSGSVVIPDHKTYGVLSYTNTGSPRITLEPRESTLQGYITSRQFPFYCWLWNKQPGRKSEDLCYDALLNLVPSHVTTVLDLLGQRSGKIKVPQVRRWPLEPYAPIYLERLSQQILRLCDEIADWMNAGMDLNEALIRFRENPDACVGFYSTCQFFELDTADEEYQQRLLEEAFVLKEAAE